MNNQVVLSSEEQEFKEAKSTWDLNVRCCHLRKARWRGWNITVWNRNRRIVLEGAETSSNPFSCSKAGAESWTIPERVNGRASWKSDCCREAFLYSFSFSELGLFEVKCTKLCVTRCCCTTAGVACAPATSFAFYEQICELHIHTGS